MREELVPFGGGEFTVFFTRLLGPAAGDERPMMGDHVFGVDRLWRSPWWYPAGHARRFSRRCAGAARRRASVTKILRKSWGPPFERLTGGGDLRGLRGRESVLDGAIWSITTAGLTGTAAPELLPGGGEYTEFDEDPDVGAAAGAHWGRVLGVTEVAGVIVGGRGAGRWDRRRRLGRR
jgi:hypothetical protein